jgi:hypothetical protein
MPTAAKLVGGVFFAVLAYVLAETFKPLLPAGTSFGIFSFICAGVGLICGWRMIGRQAGAGYFAALGTGLGTAVMSVLAATLLFSMLEMLNKAVGNFYTGAPMEAVQDAVAIVTKYARLMWDQDFLTILVVGGLLGGLITEFVGRRWK